MKKTFLITTLLIFSFGWHANAQDITTVATLISAKEKLDDILQRGENMIDRQRQQAFIDLSALLTYSFDQLEGQLNDLDRKLTKHERALFAELEKLTDKAEEALNNQRIELFNDLDVSVGNAIADLPLTKNKPYPVSTKVPFIGENSNEVIRIKIKGVKLDNDKNYAELNGVKSTKTFVTSNKELVIEIPNEPGKLSIGSSNVLKVVLFKGKRKTYNYEIPVWVYPKKLAKLSFHYTYTENVKTTERKTRDISMRSGNSCGWTHRSENIGRINSGQWKINTNSITQQELGQAPGGGECEIGTVTEAMFGVKVTARSNCGGARRFNPERGTTTCRYRWEEYLNTPTEFNDIATIEVGYNESKVLADFQKGITRFKKVVIEYYNGQVFEFSDNSYHNGILLYDFDPSRELFSIKSTFLGFTD